jgi:hypothetical protein
MASLLDTSDGEDDTDDTFAQWSGMLPSADTFAETFTTPSPRRPREANNNNSNNSNNNNSRRAGGLGAGAPPRGPAPATKRDGGDGNDDGDDVNDHGGAAIVPLAEEVLGAIERDSDALASSVASLVANLKVNLATCSDTVEHLAVHLEASEAGAYIAIVHCVSLIAAVASLTAAPALPLTD